VSDNRKLTFADLTVINGLAARYCVLLAVKRRSEAQQAELLLLKLALAEYNVDTNVNAKARK
jgi:hypothetical protein